MLHIEGIKEFNTVCQQTSQWIEVKYEPSYAYPPHIIDKLSRGDFYVFEVTSGQFIDVTEHLIGHILLSRNHYILGIEEGGYASENNTITGYVLQYIVDKSEPLTIKATVIRKKDILTSESFSDYVKEWLPKQLTIS